MLIFVFWYTLWYTFFHRLPFLYRKATLADVAQLVEQLIRNQ